MKCNIEHSCTQKHLDLDCGISLPLVGEANNNLCSHVIGGACSEAPFDNAMTTLIRHGLRANQRPISRRKILEYISSSEKHSYNPPSMLCRGDEHRIDTSSDDIRPYVPK